MSLYPDLKCLTNKGENLHLWALNQSFLGYWIFNYQNYCTKYCLSYLKELKPFSKVEIPRRPYTSRRP